MKWKYFDKILPSVIIILGVFGIIVIIITIIGLFGGISLPNSINEFAKSIEDSRKGYWELFTKSVTIFVVIGALWKYWETKRLHDETVLKNEFDSVKLKIMIEYINTNIPIIHTQIINDVKLDKGIKHAFLLISKKNGSNNFLFQINENLGTDFNCTNDLIGTAPIVKKLSKGFAYIPLPFYYNENIVVGNEILQFSYSITHDELELINSELNLTHHYEVRFFIFRTDGGYHRSTATALILFSTIN